MCVFRELRQLRIHAVLAAIRRELNGPFSIEDTHFTLKNSRYTTHISTAGNTFKLLTRLEGDKRLYERLVRLPNMPKHKSTFRKYLGAKPFCKQNNNPDTSSFRIDGSPLVKSPISTFYEFCRFLYTSICQFLWVYVIGIQVSYRTLRHQLFWTLDQ